MFSLPLQTRPSDCDVHGHVNNAVYVSHFEQTLARCLATRGFIEDWRSDGKHFWAPHSLILEYRQAAQFGETLEGHLWLAEASPTRPAFGFEIFSSADVASHTGSPYFRALGTWVRHSRNGSEPQQIPPESLAGLSLGGGAFPRAPRAVTPTPGTRKYSFEHRVESNEATASGHIHLQLFYGLLEKSVSQSCEQAGWPPERWMAAGFFTVQTRHDTQIFTLPKVGEAVGITSQLIEARRQGGTWQLEVHRGANRELLARDFSTGVHLTLEGRPASPPAQIMKDIQFG